jgi:ABC-type phosphate transport system substrate-binding protein
MRRNEVTTMRKIIVITIVVLAALVSSAPPTVAQSNPGFKIIVNARNPITSASRAELARIFLKKSTSWKNDSAIAPVDQTVSTGAREAFSRSVHGKSARAIKQYWTQQIYSGRAVPPPELGGDAKVVAFVSANPGAIGYVAADAVIGDTKLVTVE